MAETRVSKPIKDQKVLDMLINMKESDVSQSFITELFGEFDGKCKCHQYDTLVIPPGKIVIGGKPNKNSFVTTAGMWVFNKYFIEPHVSGVTGYVMEPMTKKTYGKIKKKLSYALMEDEITVADVKDYLEKTQEFMKFTTILSWHWSDKMLTLTDVVDKEKNKLRKQNKEALDAGDIKVAEDMEKQLLKYATDYIGNDPGMDGFLSGAGGTVGNNFKNMYVMKGAQKDAITGKYNVITSNYADGVSKDEYSKMANSLSIGPYSRANKTAIGGWNEKRYVLAFQEMKLGPKGSDCGTNKTITVTLEGSYLTQMMYSYIVEGNRLVRLDSTNMDKYKGKTVKMRFASLCHGVGKTHDFCNKCIGDYFYIIGMENVGIATAQLQSTLKNIAMKAFHDGTLKYTTIDLNKAFPDE